jgi:aspartate kinase
MSILVQKFGGTSMGSIERITRAAEIIEQAVLCGHKVVAVVSAMAGETDRLIKLAHQINDKIPDREYSMMVSTGEQVSMSLLAMSLMARGIKARSMTGWQANIKTHSGHKKARIDSIEPTRIEQALENGEVVVVAGFQGVSEDGDITTLGRGGSDTSAVALAASLKAKECQIYTDVDGVYTTDPRMVPEARRLSKITFEEMLEMASLGAKVLQIRSVEFAGKYNIPLRVLSSFEEGPGTLITYEGKDMEHAVVSGIAFNRTEAKITLLNVPNKPGIASRILGAVSNHNIDIDMIIQNIGDNGKTDFTFTVHRDEYDKALAELKEIEKPLGITGVIGDPKIAKLSIVGVGMKSHAGIASKMFEALAGEGINIQLISTSEIKISVVIDEKYLELGVRALHSAFELDKEPVEEFDPQLCEKALS